MNDSWHSYPSTFALGHRALAELLLDPVLVEEKIDGSQFSWCFNGELRCRSKGATLNLLAPEKMFKKAIETAASLTDRLTPGWTYRAEYLAKPKHNALAYDRVPAGHLIVFDINTGYEAYLSWEQKAAEAERLGLEVVPRLHEGMLTDVAVLRDMLNQTSILGGQKIEGVVVKNYARYGLDKKVLIGKFVSEAFKEAHAAEWKAANPTAGDIVQQLIQVYASPARWAKAVQHLRDAGQLEDSPRDIERLMKEVPDDVLKECEADIRNALFVWAWPKIRRGLAAGLPAWYKDELLKQQFNREERDDTQPA